MSAYTFRQFTIRPDMVAAIRRYVDERIPPGDFLTAVIDNDLKEAVKRADDDNVANLPAFVAYFYNEVPGPCWGSPTRRRAWLAPQEAADRA